MTTFAEFHLAIRRLVEGRGFTFVATVQSTEHHPGRVDVQWSGCILIEGKPSVVARSLSPSIVLEQLEKQMQSAVPSLAPPALRDVGSPVGPVDEPVDLVNLRGHVGQTRGSGR